MNDKGRDLKRLSDQASCEAGSCRAHCTHQPDRLPASSDSEGFRLCAELGRKSVESIRGIHAINYRAHIHKYLIPFFKDYSMKDITGEAVQEFVSSSTVSPKTTRNIFLTLQSMWSSARAWGCVVASVTLDGSGGFHMVEKENIHMTGSGSLGNSYEGNQEENFQRNGRVGLEQTNPLTVSAIGTGPAPNFEVHVLLHFTVNANGTVTVFFEHFTSSCRG